MNRDRRKNKYFTSRFRRVIPIIYICKVPFLPSEAEDAAEASDTAARTTAETREPAEGGGEEAGDGQEPSRSDEEDGAEIPTEANGPMTSNYARGGRVVPDPPLAATRTRRESDVANYDQTRRRAAKRQKREHGAYMDRSGNGSGRRGAKRSAAVAIGTTVVERIVRGRYEWRDGGRDERPR